MIILRKVLNRNITNLGFFMFFFLALLHSNYSSSNHFKKKSSYFDDYFFYKNSDENNCTSLNTTDCSFCSPGSVYNKSWLNFYYYYYLYLALNQCLKSINKFKNDYPI